LAAVTALLGKSALGAEDLAGIRVNDLGTHFTITVNGKTRDYADNARDCTERARIAAVFVGLTLAPPDIAGANEPNVTVGPADSTDTKPSALPPVQTAPAPSPSAPAPPVRKQPTNDLAAHVEIGAKAAYDPGHGQGNFGALARFGATHAHWGASLGFDVPARAAFELQGVRVQQSRYTADVALRHSWIHESLALRVDFGPSLTWLQLRQVEAPTAERVTRWVPGLRAGALLLLGQHRISPFFGADVAFVPFRIPIIVEPEGTVGHVSSVWLGAILGVAITTH
jgi:hypothetical protein